MTHNVDDVRAEALRRWLHDGWLEQDFEEKGALYRYGVEREWAELNDGTDYGPGPEDVDDSPEYHAARNDGTSDS